MKELARQRKEQAKENRAKPQAGIPVNSRNPAQANRRIRQAAEKKAGKRVEKKAAKRNSVN